MININLKKILVVGCIILFLGTTFNPITYAQQVERKKLVTIFPNPSNVNFDISDETNHMCLIYGEGQGVLMFDIKMVTIQGMIEQFTILKQLFLQLWQYSVLFAFLRPRFVIGYGYWLAENGGNITTIGVNGSQKWGTNEEGWAGIWLIGFIGVVVPSKSPEDEGCIFGFSLMSAPVVPW